MPKSIKTTLITSIFIVSFFQASHSAVLAVSKPTGITVSPAFQQVTVASGETKHPVTFSITNDKAVAQTVSLSAADFNTLNESGGLFFVGTNPTALQKKYGLADWFDITQNRITIGPKQTQIVKADILNLPSMTGGGHYGALMIRLDSPGNGLSDGNNIAIDPIASSLMFVTKIGGDTHNLSLTNVSYRQSIFKIPDSVKLIFKDSGNSHVVPRGIIKIVSPSGKIVSQGTINQDSNIVLPESSRVYDVNLRQLDISSRPGKYKLYVDFRFDGINQPRGYQASFWIIQTSWLVAAVMVLVLLISSGIYLLRRRTVKE